MLPTGIAESTDLIMQVDRCLLAGFTNLENEQHEALQSLGRVFSGSPLGGKLSASIDDLTGGVFQPDTFLVLAAARAALQGAQYDCLLRVVKESLGREVEAIGIDAPTVTEGVPPLLASVRHWLMDLAITGFARLEPAIVTSFFSTLAQLQAQPEYVRTSVLITGFVNELLSQSGEIPLYRWGDLWARAMLTTIPTAPPAPSSISGALHPLGIAWRQHPHVTSMVIYGVVEDGSRAEMVRITLTEYKVDALQNEQVWLLFPQVAMLLDGLASGNTITLNEMPYLAGGHVLWDEACAKAGAGYKLMETALKYFAVGAKGAVSIPAMPAEQRHPIHIAEPVALANYTLGGDAEAGWSIEAGGSTYYLEPRSAVGSELGSEALAGADHLFGLLRFDAGSWWLQPLAISKGKGKPTFIGKESSKLLKKPPKDSTVSILKERASKLLREKS